MERNVKRSEIYSNLIILGTAHALVDTAGIALSFIISEKAGFDHSFSLLVILAYNIIAFGFQPVVGSLIDRMESPKSAAISGCVITALALVLGGLSPVFIIPFVALGNAIFHTGAGSICLNLTQGKASPVGIFVAPGALGVYFGTAFGISGNFPVHAFAAMLAIICIAIGLLKKIEIDYSRKIIMEKNSPFMLFFALILFTVALRSLVGFCTAFPWKSDPALAFLLTLAIVFGKGAGGILADRFGWMPVTVSSLAISAPLISYFAYNPYTAIFGIFLFNFSMPVTLAATSNILPGRPAFAFGLTCLALVAGALPTFFYFSESIKTQHFVSVMALISAITVYLGLKNYDKIFDCGFRAAQTRI